MAASVCPTCDSPIDPTEAPVARIRAAKVVTYCSDECADADTRESLDDAASGDESGRASAGPGLSGEREGDSDPGILPGLGAEFPLARLVRFKPASNRKRQIIALSAAIMVGGMAITIINAVSPSSPSRVSAASHNVHGAASHPGPQSAGQRQSAVEAATSGDDGGEHGAATSGASPAEPQALFERATATLRQLMASPSRRVQRIAAMALARTGDSAALAVLTSLLDSEEYSLVHIDTAYALARVGDPRGKKILLKGLRAKRRDTRVDAARSLVQLGDDRGLKTLRRMLSLRTHRLGAAGLLARRGDREGTAALYEARSDGASSEETRMRALVELGRAGDASVRDELFAILEDGRYLVGAADALAALGDHRAKEALNRQLDISSLRVRAALALRRLGAGADLDVLAAALEAGSEQARVTAAEAALVLTGPKELAEFD